MLARRRQVLGGIVAAGAMLYTSSLARAQAGELCCFMQESGDYFNNPFVVAAVLTDDLAACEERIRALRAATGYNKPLKDRRNDPTRLPFMTGLIDLILSADGPWVAAQLVTGEWPDGPVARDGICFAQYRQIVDAPLQDFDSARLVVPSGDEPRVKLLVQHLGTELTTRPAIEQESRPQSDVGQLAWLVANLIRSDAVGDGNEERRQVLDHLKSSMQVESLSGLVRERFAVRTLAL